MKSPFSMSDAYMFLQASPLSRSLMNKMSILPMEVRNIICGNVESFATRLCDGYLQPQFRETAIDPVYRSTLENKFYCPLTANGLSFALGTADAGPEFNPKSEIGLARRNSSC